MSNETRVIVAQMGFDVVEDANYKQSLQRKDGDPTHLYSVIIRTPHGETLHSHVLASSEETAINQATPIGLNSYDIPDELEGMVFATAKRIPMLVMGWGSTEF